MNKTIFQIYMQTSQFIGGTLKAGIKPADLVAKIVAKRAEYETSNGKDYWLSFHSELEEGPLIVDFPKILGFTFTNVAIPEKKEDPFVKA